MIADRRNETWVTSWTTSLGGPTGGFLGPETTIRQTMRLTLGGEALRIRLANPYALSPLVVESVSVGMLGADPRALTSTPIPVLFGGSRRVVVHPGQHILSDSVQMTAEEGAQISISMYVDRPTEITTHDWANRLSWTTLSATGDQTHDIGGANFRPWCTGWAWIDAVDVRGSAGRGAIVAIGDSITDGAGSEFGTDTRWTDRLAERLLRLPVGDPRRLAVLNAGIGGNTMGGYGNSTVGPNVLARLERDALSHTSVRTVIVAAGSNDIYLGGTIEQLTHDWTDLASQARKRGLRALIATIIPRIGGYGWSQAMEEQRQRANTWIRSQSSFHGFLEFERGLVDDTTGRLRTKYDADGTHPSSAGYAAIADGIDLDLLTA